MVLYKMLVGRMPFQTENVVMLIDNIKNEPVASAFVMLDALSQSIPGSGCRRGTQRDSENALGMGDQQTHHLFYFSVERDIKGNP